MSLLAGKRILVVEDDFLISRMVLDILADAEVVVVGPAATRDAGLVIAQTHTLDAAVLDINLRGLRSDDIADELYRRGIPFVIATGYGEQSRLPGVPVLPKPYTEDRLLRVLETILKNRS